MLVAKLFDKVTYWPRSLQDFIIAQRVHFGLQNEEYHRVVELLELCMVGSVL
jgi:hypothetical protein